MDETRITASDPLALKASLDGAGVFDGDDLAWYRSLWLTALSANATPPEIERALMPVVDYAARTLAVMEANVEADPAIYTDTQGNLIAAFRGNLAAFVAQCDGLSATGLDEPYHTVYANYTAHLLMHLTGER